MRLKPIQLQISRIRRSLKAIWNHPLTQEDKTGALRRYISFHVLGRLVPGPILFPYVGQTCFLARPGMAGIVGNIYMGLEDFEEQAFLLHFLRPGDLFVDVGANVGAYSLLASGVCRADSLAIEPIPDTFFDLMRNIRVNDLLQFAKGCNAGVGSCRTQSTFTTRLGTMNRIVNKDDQQLSKESVVDMEVLPLDELLEGRSPALLKVDVEGYEQEVISGAKYTLQSPNLRAILIELFGHENRYGFSNENVHNDLLSYGFLPCNYHPFERRLEKISTFNRCKFNTLYVRNLEWVNARLKQAEYVKVLDQLI